MRYISHILPPHLLPQRSSTSLHPPFYPCDQRNLPVQALPTIMATVGSYSFRNAGPGMLWNTKTNAFEEPPPSVREIALGHPVGITSAPGIPHASRIKLIGNSFDMHAINYLLTAAFLLNSHLLPIPPAVNALTSLTSDISQQTPLSLSQLKGKYSSFAIRELRLWGYSPGQSLGITYPGLLWPLHLTPSRADLDDLTQSPVRHGIGYTDSLVSGGGSIAPSPSQPSQLFTIFVRSTDSDELTPRAVIPTESILSSAVLSVSDGSA